jgi:hypothetical protein
VKCFFGVKTWRSCALSISRIHLHTSTYIHIHLKRLMSAQLSKKDFACYTQRKTLDDPHKIQVMTFNFNAGLHEIVKGNCSGCSFSAMYNDCYRLCMHKRYKSIDFIIRHAIRALVCTTYSLFYRYSIVNMIKDILLFYVNWQKRCNISSKTIYEILDEECNKHNNRLVNSLKRAVQQYQYLLFERNCRDMGIVFGDY